MEIKKQLEEVLGKIVTDLAKQETNAQVEIPQDLNKGDFTSSIALKIGEKLGGPMEAGEKIIDKLREDNDLYSKFAKIELVIPGFINFYLSTEVVASEVAAAVKGLSPKEEHSSLILEFGDLNPFKEPHIGHVRNLVLGEALARLLEFGGTKVIRANYEGDVGMHVAKCIYGIQNSKFKIQNFEDKPLGEKIDFLAKCYAMGAKAFEEDDGKKQEITSINNKIYTSVNSKVKSQKSKVDELDEESQDMLKLWEVGRAWSLDYFEELYKKLGVAYDKYYFESEVSETGKKTVEENPDVFEKDENAYVFRGENYGLHTRVFINNQGHPTYESKDLGLAITKNQDYPEIEKSIIMTANEQIDYFKVLLKALTLVDQKLGEKTEHLSFGFVNLKEGKMSSRTGNVVGANWLLDETKKRLKEGFKEVENGVLDDLTVASVKWSMLKFSRESDIKFDISESIDLAGNSGPYMQYTYARIASILVKSENKDFEANSVKNLDKELLALGRMICQFESVVKTATDNFSPNFLTDYLFVLAQKFNAFYEKEKIIGGENEDAKLAICRATKNVIGQGLKLLGISTPEKI